MNYGLVTKSLAISEITDEQLSLINTYTRRPLTKDEVFVFSLNLCSNEVDRDFERFSIDSLNTLQALMLGKTGIFDHSSKAENQAARIFYTEVIPSNDITSTGEQHHILKAYAYMLRTAKNEDLILEIDGGIKKEVSISCAIKKTSCSICGADMKAMPCEHKKGSTYTDSSATMLCHYILDEPSDAYEWSFVAVPAQKAAGVTKAYQAIENIAMSNDTDDLAKLYELAEIGKEYHESLRREFVKLSAFAYSSMNTSLVEEASRKMSVAELREFNKAFSPRTSEVIPNGFQLFSEENQLEHSNNHFKI